MKKFWNRFIRICAAVLMSASTISSVAAVPVEAETLTGYKRLEDVFDLTHITHNTAMGVKEIVVSNGSGEFWAFCVEPTKGAHSGDTYSKVDSLTGSFNYDGALKALAAAYDDYYDNALHGTLGEYLAVQLAVWGKETGIDPATLAIKASYSDPTYAAQIRDLAHNIYTDADSKNIASGNHVVLLEPGTLNVLAQDSNANATNLTNYTANKNYSMNLADHTSGVTLSGAEYDGQIYYETGLFSVDPNQTFLLYNMKYTVSISGAPK
jgi:hypothetical protein